jgi:hypothetical protein
MDIARLGKAGVLARIPDPANKRQFLYDLRQSVRGCVAHLNTPAEKAQARFALAKAMTEKHRARKLSLEIAIKR